MMISLYLIKHEVKKQGSITIISPLITEEAFSYLEVRNCTENAILHPSNILSIFSPPSPLSHLASASIHISSIFLLSLLHPSLVWTESVREKCVVSSTY